MRRLPIASDVPVTSETNSEQGVAIAERMLDGHVRPAIDDEVAVTEVREFPTCWVIGFNTVAYLETGRSPTPS